MQKQPESAPDLLQKGGRRLWQVFFGRVLSHCPETIANPYREKRSKSEYLGPGRLQMSISVGLRSGLGVVTKGVSLKGISTFVVCPRMTANAFAFAFKVDAKIAKSSLHKLSVYFTGRLYSPFCIFVNMDIRGDGGSPTMTTCRMSVYFRHQYHQHSDHAFTMHCSRIGCLSFSPPWPLVAKALSASLIKCCARCSS